MSLLHSAGAPDFRRILPQELGTTKPLWPLRRRIAGDVIKPVHNLRKYNFRQSISRLFWRVFSSTTWRRRSTRKCNSRSR